MARPVNGRPLQFASLYIGQEVFVWSDCLLDPGTDFLDGNVLTLVTWKTALATPTTGKKRRREKNAA